MRGETLIPGEIRSRIPQILSSWRAERGSAVAREEFPRLEERMEGLVGVFADFLESPESVETFSQGGAVHELVDEIAASQYALGRDAVGVIEDFAALRRCLWSTVESVIDLSSLEGEEVARFFAKLMQASDWITGTGLETYDATVRQGMEEALGEAAATDLVTGLPSRELFNRLLLPNAVESHERFAIAVFDVAGFSETVVSGRIKRARRALRRLAEAVGDAAPESAICARFGDDEICAILPETDSEGAYRIAEEVLRSLLEDENGFEVDVGVAEYPAHAAEAENLMFEMLDALKMAKRVGGSGIVVAKES